MLAIGHISADFLALNASMAGKIGKMLKILFLITRWNRKTEHDKNCGERTGRVRI
jgi:hypothetical protein